MSEFTPGPWYVSPRTGPGLITSEVFRGNNGECITDGVYEIADANLISAAPDLHTHAEALINSVCKRYGVGVDGLTCPHMIGLAAAIEKARGEIK